MKVVGLYLKLATRYTKKKGGGGGMNVRGQKIKVINDLKIKLKEKDFLRIFIRDSNPLGICVASL